MNTNTRFVVKSFDPNGNLVHQQTFWDEYEADGWAAGRHVHYGVDTWVNDVQIFSHKTPYNRLVPGLPD